jgi:predicted nuclease of predicted toxin-antitoxin system
VRLLVDQNVPRAVVDTLREVGHDVEWIQTTQPGATDRGILRRASSDRRVILTLDTDFGELGVHRGLPVESGVLPVRAAGAGPDNIASIVRQALETRDTWTGVFAVIENSRIRIRPLSD